MSLQIHQINIKPNKKVFCFPKNYFATDSSYLSHFQKFPEKNRLNQLSPRAVTAVSSFSSSSTAETEARMKAARVTKKMILDMVTVTGGGVDGADTR